MAEKELKEFKDKVLNGYKTISKLAKERINSMDDVVNLVKRLLNKDPHNISDINEEPEFKCRYSKPIEVTKKPTGLTNGSSVCYLNASLQALASSSVLMKQMNEMSKIHTSKKLKLLIDLLDKLHKGDKNMKFAADHKLFDNWKKRGMQDSFELISYLMGEVNNEIKSSKNINQSDWLKMPVPLLLKIEYEFVCKMGHVVYSPLQLDLALHLTISSNYKRNLNVQNLLDNFKDTESIDSYECDRCDIGTNEGKKKMRLCEVPNTLILHLQRSYINRSGKLLKNSKRIETCFSVTLRSSYFQGNCSSDQRYTLVSVIQHTGNSLNSGHYTCYRKISDTWYHINDANVQPVYLKAVQNCDNYILIYESDSSVTPTFDSNITSSNNDSSIGVSVCNTNNNDTENVNTNVNESNHNSNQYVKFESLDNSANPIIRQNSEHQHDLSDMNNKVDPNSSGENYTNFIQDISDALPNNSQNSEHQHDSSDMNFGNNKKIDSKDIKNSLYHTNPVIHSENRAQQCTTDMNNNLDFESINTCETVDVKLRSNNGVRRSNQNLQIPRKILTENFKVLKSLLKIHPKFLSQLNELKDQVESLNKFYENIHSGTCDFELSLLGDCGTLFEEIMGDVLNEWRKCIAKKSDKVDLPFLFYEDASLIIWNSYGNSGKSLDDIVTDEINQFNINPQYFPFLLCIKSHGKNQNKMLKMKISGKYIEYCLFGCLNMHNEKEGLWRGYSVAEESKKTKKNAKKNCFVQWKSLDENDDNVYDIEPELLFYVRH